MSPCKRGELTGLFKFNGLLLMNFGIILLQIENKKATMSLCLFS